MLQDFFTKLSDQEKKIFYVAVAIAAFAAFDLLFFQPVGSRLKALDRDIGGTKDEIKRNVRFLAYKTKILKEEDAFKTFETDEEKAERDVIPLFLKTIETLASESEVSVAKLNRGESTSKKGFTEYYANLECTGKMENIVKFIHKIDTTNNLLKVVKISLVGKKSSAEEVTASIKVAKLMIDGKVVGREKVEGEAAGQEKTTNVFGNATAGAGTPALGVGGAGGAGGSADGGPGQGPGGSAGGGAGGGPGGAGTNAEGGAGGGGDGAGGGQKGGAGGGAGAGASGGAANAAPGAPGQGGAGGGAAGAPGAKPAGAQSGGQAGGEGGSGGADVPGQPKTAQEQEEEKQTKKNTPLDDVNKGERLEIKKGFEELWNDFWGIKEKEVKTPAEKSKFNTKEYKTEDELKPNLWERMLDKGEKPAE